jgi:hypothetical protein
MGYFVMSPFNNPSMIELYDTIISNISLFEYSTGCTYLWGFVESDLEQMIKKGLNENMEKGIIPIQFDSNFSMHERLECIKNFLKLFKETDYNSLETLKTIQTEIKFLKMQLIDLS